MLFFLFLIFFFYLESSDQDGNDDDEFVPPKPKKSKNPEHEGDISTTKGGNAGDDANGSDDDLDPHIKKIMDRTEQYRRGEAIKRTQKPGFLSHVVSRPETVSELVEKSSKSAAEGNKLFFFLNFFFLFVY